MVADPARRSGRHPPCGPLLFGPVAIGGVLRPGRGRLHGPDVHGRGLSASMPAGILCPTPIFPPGVISAKSITTGCVGRGRALAAAPEDQHLCRVASGTRAGICGAPSIGFVGPTLLDPVAGVTQRDAVARPPRAQPAGRCSASGSARPALGSRSRVAGSGYAGGRPAAVHHLHDSGSSRGVRPPPPLGPPRPCRHAETRGLLRGPRSSQ